MSNTILRGEKLIDLLVYLCLKDRYEGKCSISDLKRMIGYGSPGGIHNALNVLKDQGYIKRERVDFVCTDKGRQKVARLIAPYNIISLLGWVLMILGIYSILTYFFMVTEILVDAFFLITTGISLIAGGIFLALIRKIALKSWKRKIKQR